MKKIPLTVVLGVLISISSVGHTAYAAQQKIHMRGNPSFGVVQVGATATRTLVFLFPATTITELNSKLDPVFQVTQNTCIVGATSTCRMILTYQSSMGGEHVGQIGLTVSGKRSKELFTVKIKGSSPGAGYAWDSEEQSAQAEAPSSIRSSFTLTSRGSVPLVIHDITANTGELTTTCPLNKEIPKGSSCAVNIFLAASAFAADTGFVRGKLAINMKTNASSTVEKPAILNWFFSLVAIRDVEVLRKN